MCQRFVVFITMIDEHKLLIIDNKYTFSTADNNCTACKHPLTHESMIDQFCRSSIGGSTWLLYVTFELVLWFLLISDLCTRLCTLCTCLYDLCTSVCDLCTSLCDLCTCICDITLVYVTFTLACFHCDCITTQLWVTGNGIFLVWGSLWNLHNCSLLLFLRLLSMSNWKSLRAFKAAVYALYHLKIVMGKWTQSEQNFFRGFLQQEIHRVFIGNIIVNLNI